MPWGNKIPASGVSPKWVKSRRRRKRRRRRKIVGENNGQLCFRPPRKPTNNFLSLEHESESEHKISFFTKCSIIMVLPGESAHITFERDYWTALLEKADKEQHIKISIRTKSCCRQQN